MTPTSTRRRRTKVRRTRGRRTGIVLGWVLLGCVALVAVAGVWTAVDALRVRDQLVEAASVVPQLEDQVLAGDDEAVAASVETLRDAASSAVTTTGRPHWTLTSWLPGVGPNVRAVQTLAGTVSDLAEGPLPSLPAVVAAASPAALAPQDGRVDVQSVAEAAPVVIAADDGVNAAIDSLAAIDRSALLPQVSDAVDQLSGELSDLRLSTATASRAVQLIPPMMGIDGPRDYLVLVQNNAEPRTLGGIVGSVLLLRADSGSIELVEQVAGNSIEFPEPIDNLTPTETALFGSQLGRFMVNVTSTPDFPRAAGLAAEMWLAARGQAVSGVVAIDPVALASLLTTTGPVDAGQGTILTSDNAAAYLLNGIYIDQPQPDAQDAFFAEAAARIFEALTSGSGDSGEMVRQLGGAAGAGRVLLWSAMPDEQALLQATNIAGELESVPHSPEVGIYINDGTGGKAGYYLKARATLDVTECRPDGSRRLRGVISLASDLPDPSSLPPYITGGGNYAEVGVIRSNIAFYAPSEGRITSITASDSGTELPVLTQLHNGRPVALTTVDVSPGGELELVVEMLTASGNQDLPTLLVTPGPRDTSTSVSSGCAANA